MQIPGGARSAGRRRVSPVTQRSSNDQQEQTSCCVILNTGFKSITSDTSTRWATFSPPPTLNEGEEVSLSVLPS